MHAARSLDHLVGAGEQRGWDSDANGLGGSRIDNKLHLRRKLYRQIGWLRTFQNPVDEIGSSTKVLTQIDAIADQTTILDVLAEIKDRGQPRRQRKGRDPPTRVDKQRSPQNDHNARALAHECLDCVADLIDGTDID